MTTQSLIRETEHLQAAGWIPVHDGVHPQQTDWIDPEIHSHEQKRMGFGEASRTQYLRDKKASKK
jgi:hypothetical protein